MSNINEFVETDIEQKFHGRIDRDHLREYLTAIDSLVDECIVSVGEGGLSSQCVDPANVAVIDAELDKSAFSEYEAAVADFGIAPGPLLDALDELPGSAPVTIVYSEQSDLVTLESGEFYYEVESIDPDVIRTADKPDSDAPETVWFESGDWTEAIDYFDAFTDRVLIGVDSADQAIYFEREQDDYEYEPDLGARFADGGRVQIDANDDVESFFSLDYLVNMAEAVPEDRNVRLQIGEQVPMWMQYNIAPESPEDDVYHGAVEYIQAPRVQKND